jgi:arabinofuranosyltransferase
MTRAAAKPSGAQAVPDVPAGAARTSAVEWGGFLAVLAVFLGLTVWYFIQVGTSVVDDAFIPLRYADRFVHGEGLVFTPGPPVEGYTSLPWTLLLALGHFLPIEPLLFARTIGILFGIGTVWLTWRTSRALLPGMFSLLPVAFVALNRSLALWSVEAMDTSLFTCALCFAFWSWVSFGTTRPRGVPLTGVAFGIAALARPEGVLLALLAGILGAIFAKRSGTLRAFAIHALCAAALVLGQLLFRIFEYGEILPNTFHAKVQGIQLGRGADYLLMWGREGLLYLPAALAVVGGIRLLRRTDRGPQQMWLPLTVLCYLVYVAVVGGDYFEYRLLVPMLPLGAILAAAGLASITMHTRKARGIVVGVGVVGLLACSAWSVVRPHPSSPQVIRPDDPAEQAEFRWFVRVARWLACRISPLETIAVRPAGVIPYLTGAPTLDMLGLNDRAIAMGDGWDVPGAAVGHQRVASPEYVARRGATYLIGHPVRARDPVRDPSIVSAEVAPGEWLLLLPLTPRSVLRPGVYRLGPRTELLEGWKPRTSGGRCVPYHPGS